MKRGRSFWSTIILLIVVYVVGVMAGRNVLPNGSETEQNEVALSIIAFLLSGCLIVLR